MYLLCYLFFIKPEPYYNFSLVGMKKTYLIKEKTTTKTKNKTPQKTQKAQTSPKETTEVPQGLKAEFPGKSSCVPCQKERGSRNIQ